MIKEYDVVRAVKDLGPNVLAGAVGTILIIYPSSEAYEIEFTRDTGETLDVLTVNSKDVVKV